MRNSRGRVSTALSKGEDENVPTVTTEKRKGSGGWIIVVVLILGSLITATLMTTGLHSVDPPSFSTPPSAGVESFTVDDSKVAAAALLPSSVTSSAQVPSSPALSPAGKQKAYDAALSALRSHYPHPGEQNEDRPFVTAPQPIPASVSETPVKASLDSHAPGVKLSSSTSSSSSQAAVSIKEDPSASSSSSSSSWVPPPSQANYGPTNGRSLPRPKPAKQSEGFLRARAATWEKGAPQLTAPYPDKYTPALYPNLAQRPLQSRQPFSLPTPLWATPHVPTNDAVLALAVNYRIIDYVRFVGTLRRTGYSGDIVLAVSAKMDENSRKFLMAMDVIAYPVAFNCSSKGGGRESVKSSLECDWHAQQDIPLPLAIIRHELYLSWAWMYAKSSRLLILDFRDTFFQRDPFESLSLGRPGEPHFQQLVVLEHWPYKRMSNCPWNSGWVRGCWGQKNFKPMANHPVLCSGSYFATRDGMIDLETELLNEVRAATCHKKGVPSDQGYVNYLYWAGRLPFATHEIRGEGIVNTVGAMMGKNHGGSIGPLRTWFQIIDSDGFVMDNDNRTRSAVVHQWDRFFDELYWTVDAVLECDACYSSKFGHGTFTCTCFKHGCKCKEG